MAALSGLESLYLSDSLLDTNPELRPRGMKISSSSTVRIGIETIVITAVIFIAVITWFEVLRSWFDNVFSETTNYRATWIRLFYAVVVTLIALFFIKLFGEDTFTAN